MSLPRFFPANGHQRTVVDYGANPVTAWELSALRFSELLLLSGRVLRPRIGHPGRDQGTFFGELGPKQVWRGAMGVTKNIPTTVGRLPNASGLGAGPPMSAALASLEAVQ